MRAADIALADRRVFVNCPFDNKYKPLFDAIVFTIHHLGFEARHARIDDDVANRLSRIAKEIAGARYSVHDLSRVELSGSWSVPRFNMPFEAGIAYCRHEFAGRSAKHHFLLLDAVAYRPNASLSDAAGLDAKIHENKVEKVINCVRTFLADKSGIKKLPGATYLSRRLALFERQLPEAARQLNVTVKELKSWEYVNDFQSTMERWIRP